MSSPAPQSCPESGAGAPDQLEFPEFRVPTHGLWDVTVHVQDLDGRTILYEVGVELRPLFDRAR